MIVMTRDLYLEEEREREASISIWGHFTPVFDRTVDAAATTENGFCGHFALRNKVDLSLFAYCEIEFAGFFMLELKYLVCVEPI